MLQINVSQGANSLRYTVHEHEKFPKNTKRNDKGRQTDNDELYKVQAWRSVEQLRYIENLTTEEKQIAAMHVWMICGPNF